MDLFRKGLKNVPAPVHVLVVVTGDCSSVFASDLLRKRLNTSLQGKSAVVRKLDTVRKDSFEGEFTLPNIVKYARENDFNCIVLCDDASTVSLGTLAVISCGRPDLMHSLSCDDYKTYGMGVLRPVRQCLVEETEFYCRHHGLAFDNGYRTLDSVFIHEKRMIEEILEDGHGDTVFAIQKLSERMPESSKQRKCPKCGLPYDQGDECALCHMIHHQ